MEPTLISTFFTGDSLARLLVYLCNTRAPGAWDKNTSKQPYASAVSASVGEYIFLTVVLA